MSDELTPITRKETFLAKAGGQNVVTPTPITREETFLQAIIDNGSGGGGGTGGGVLVVGIDLQTMTLDKTWNEIYSAPLPVIKLSIDGNSFQLFHVEQILNADNERFTVYVTSWNPANSVFRGAVFECDSADGYPVMRQG